MKHLGKNGLSMSQAQSISNLCNQRAIEIDNTIRNFNVVSKTVKIDREIYELQEANPISDAIELLEEKGKLHGTQAFLMEAIKSKEDLLHSIRNENLNLSAFTMPERTEIDMPNYAHELTEEFGWSKLSAKEYAEYLDVESAAAHYGQFIHKLGKLTALRNILAKNTPLEWEVVEEGKKTPVKVVKHHTPSELAKLHENIAKLHGLKEQRVNYFKAKVKNLTSAENVLIHKNNSVLKQAFDTLCIEDNAEYESALKAYHNEVSIARSEFEADREQRLNDASKLRIVVDSRFQGTVDVLIA